ncbi:MAG: hypothetical protein KJO31_09355 [Gammaproteobacteria bacterium]|nr:hypothetical protein [Gammaproteobacteria bacterium]
MIEWIAGGILAVAVAWGIYVLMESREIFSASRSARQKPVSGVGASIGTSARVIDKFSTGPDERITGRVRFEGEEWNAVFVGSSDATPGIGDSVTITDVDASRLEVRVTSERPAD